MPSEDAKPPKKHSVRREEEDDEDEKSLRSILKNKKPNPLANAAAAKPRPKEVKVKKGEGGEKKPLRLSGSGSGGLGSSSKGVTKLKNGENDDDENDKPISRRIFSVKPDKDMAVKKKAKQEEVKKTVKVEEKKKRSADESAVETKKKREKKVYDLPGQKRDPPEERDPLRIFYETLHQQIPRSEMAQIWLMESGLLPKEEAKKVFEKKQRKSHAQRLSSPAKAAVSVKRSSEKTVSVKKNLSSPVKTAEIKVSSKQSKKREDRSSGEDSDDDFVISTRIVKRQK